MNASELADEFSLLHEGYENADNIAVAHYYYREIADTAMLSMPEIIEVLRFAAYMEKLMESDDREIVFRRLSGGRIQLSTLWRENGELKIFNRVFSDSDIYSAARKAVEALEGKQ